ncbi:AraC family transcriptional regulator [Actinoplanes sp. NPDC051861]|uniref:AraC family transcriptional regulator n=1 Tax=Actinoplanes sp. NPDC051861 TaxID=3155170 RepID=UPI003412414E
MNPTPASVPMQRGEVETADLAVAHDLVCRRYAEHTVRLRDPAADFLFRVRSAATTDIVVDEIVYRASVEVTSQPFPDFAVIAFRTGRYAAQRDGEWQRCGPGDAVLLPVDAPFEVTWDRIELLLTRIPQPAVLRMAAQLGVEPGDFRFHGMRPVSAERSRHWQTTLAYLSRSFAGPHPAVTAPLVHQSTLDLLAAAALTVFPNTTMTAGHLTGPGRAEPRAVRRAVAFIDGHAGEPVALEDIAAAAGLGVRGLQAAFARHLDTTPTGYLRRVRLERARRDLQDGDRALGDTVEAIARRWGFPNPGRFAAEYRRTYGESPGHTLRA